MQVRSRRVPQRLRSQVAQQGEDERLSAALQRLLLPAGLPEVAGWSVAALYEPVGDTVLVGGDFYDWFRLPNGRVLFFVGDVSGKGPLAGALGMSIRKALKGITWVTGDAFEALPFLEAALADEFREAFATLCLVELTPGSGTLRLLVAGHTAPWVRTQGRFRELVVPTNGLLGPGLQENWHSSEVELDAGDLLMVFSDGLSEARLPDGRLFGEGPMTEFLTSLPPGLAGYETVLRAEAQLHDLGCERTDDTIIAVLTYLP